MPDMPSVGFLQGLAVTEAKHVSDVGGSLSFATPDQRNDVVSVGRLQMNLGSVERAIQDGTADGVLDAGLIERFNQADDMGKAALLLAHPAEIDRLGVVEAGRRSKEDFHIFTGDVAKVFAWQNGRETDEAIQRVKQANGFTGKWSAYLDSVGELKASEQLVAEMAKHPDQAIRNRAKNLKPHVKGIVEGTIQREQLPLHIQETLAEFIGPAPDNPNTRFETQTEQAQAEAAEETLGVYPQNDNPDEQGTAFEVVMDALAYPGQRTRSIIAKYGYGGTAVEDRFGQVPERLASKELVNGILTELAGEDVDISKLTKVPEFDRNQPYLPQIKNILIKGLEHNIQATAGGAALLATEVATDPLVWLGPIVKTGKSLSSALYNGLTGFLKKREKVKVLKPTDPATPPPKGNDVRIEQVQDQFTRIRDEVKADPRPFDVVYAEAAERINTRWTLDDVRAIGANRNLNDTDMLAVQGVAFEQGKQLHSLVKTYQKTQSADDFTAVVKQLGVMAEILPKAQAVRTASGRAQKILQSDIPEVTKRLSQELDNLFESGVTNPAAFAKQLEQITDPMSQLKFVDDLAKPNGFDIYSELYINSLLSGPQTHAINLTSNAMQLVSLVGERQIAALTGKNIPLNEGYIMAKAMVQNFSDIMRLSFQSFKSGEPLFGTGTKLNRNPAFTATNLRNTKLGSILPENGAIDGMVNALGKVARIPSRLLLTGDEIFKGLAYRAELTAEAQRLAITQTEKLALSPKAKIKEQQRIMQNVLAAPEQFGALHRTAQRTAEFATFTEQSGSIGRVMSGIADAHPLVRVVLPFVNTPLNIFRGGLELTPGLQFASKKFRQALRSNNPVTKQKAQAKLAISGGLAGTISYYTAQGNITGSGPHDPRLRALKGEVWKPYSLALDTDQDGTPDEYVPYNRLGPIGFAMGIVADFTEISGHLTQGQIERFATSFGLALGENVMDATFLQSLAQFGHLFHTAQMGKEKQLASEINRLAPNFIVPANSALRTISRTISPELKEVRTLVDSFKNTVPGFGDGAFGTEPLALERDMAGHPITYDPGFGPSFSDNWLSTMVDLVHPIRVKRVQNKRQQSIIQSLVNDEIMVSKPTDEIQGIELTNRELDRYRELYSSGGGKLPPLLDQLGALLDSAGYKNASSGREGGKQLLVSGLISARKQAAQQIMLDEFGEIQETAVTVRQLNLRDGSPLKETPAQKSIGIGF